MRTLSLARGRWRTISMLASILLLVEVGTAFAQSGSRTETSEARLTEARRHFELGVAHFDRQEWQAALVEFLSSRALSRTRGNTKNAAICLRKVGRFDEALDMFEALLREFPDLSAADRELAAREIAELGASVGTIELLDAPPGAHVSIDGVDRGTTPLAGPVRLPAGTHTVRVVKDGMPPFETRVDLAGRRAEVVRVRIAALTQAGRLRISEKNGKTVEVVVDGARVGTTPWDGALAPGVHSVWLHGAGNLATPPARVAIEVGKEVALVLEARPLNSELEVFAQPATAEISVDGAPAARGSWRGRLAAGEHRIEVTLAGHEPFVATRRLVDGQRQRVVAVLEPRLPNDKIQLELDAGIPIGLLWGGDLEGGCTPPCSSSLPLGLYAQAHALYRFAIGFGVGVHAGYLRIWTTLAERAESHAVGDDQSNQGVVDDHLRVAGLLAGAEADYVLGTQWPVTLRVAAGALIGAATDSRTGSFVDSVGVDYEVSRAVHPRASYFYIGPEIRLGHRVGKHVEASLGTKMLVLAALDRPSWDGRVLVRASERDRAGVFSDATLTGGIMIAVLPGATIRYTF